MDDDGFRYQFNKRQVKTKLLKLLRHTGLKEGLQFNNYGYTSVSGVLEHPSLVKHDLYLEDLQSLIKNGNSPLELTQLKDESWVVRAKNGHSMIFGDNNHIITNPTQAPMAVFRVSMKAWNNIKYQGLSLPGDKIMWFNTRDWQEVPKDTKDTKDTKKLDDQNDQNGKPEMIRIQKPGVYIYLNVAKCIQDQIDLYLTPRQKGAPPRILTRGTKYRGVNTILPKYFAKVKFVYPPKNSKK